MSENTQSLDNRADKYALDFITKHTKFETDGKVYRALVESFIAFEREMPNADIENRLNLSYELGQVVAFEDLAKRFRTKSGELFANDKNEHAVWLKVMASELEKETEDMRKSYTKKRDGK